MIKDHLRLILKALIESQFIYCLLIWMFHSRSMNNRINRLHERALRLVYNGTNLTFQELLELDNSFTMHHRNLQRLATEMYKVKNNLFPTFMNNIFPGSKNPIICVSSQNSSPIIFARYITGRDKSLTEAQKPGH